MLTNKHKAQLIIAASFVLGIVVGAAGQFLLLQKSLSRANGSSPPDTLSEITRVTGLNDEQKNAVKSVLDDSQRQYQELRNQIRPQTNAIREETRNRIRTLLSLDQQDLFNRWTQELDAKRTQKEQPSPNNK